MPYILISKYYKHADVSCETVATEEELRDTAIEWFNESCRDDFPSLSELSTPELIRTLLDFGEDHICQERGWAYCAVFEVNQVIHSWLS